MQLESLKNQVRLKLTPRRYEHTLGVIEAASVLAPVFQADPESLALAALLHDCAKDLPLEQQFSLAAQDTEPLTEADRKAAGIIHARAGAVLASQEYHIDNPAVIDAIRYHSTGRAGYSNLGRALFASDYLDPSRRLQDNIPLMKLTISDPKKGLLEILKTKMLWVLGKNAPLHPDSVAFYNSLL